MVIFRELEKVRFIMKEATNLDVSYAYEDLVFSEHSVYIIKFIDDEPNTLHCYFDKDCYNSNRRLMLEQLVTVADLNDMKLLYKGTFIIKEKKDSEEIDIEFIENK